MQLVFDKELHSESNFIGKVFKLVKNQNYENERVEIFFQKNSPIS